jgi:hypothetical protein
MGFCASRGVAPTRLNAAATARVFKVILGERITINLRSVRLPGW